MYKFIRYILYSVFISISFNADIKAQRKKRRPTHADSSLIKATVPDSPKDIVIKYGIASFYAQKFHGRQTANGDIFSSLKLTAACNVLPLGIWIKVTNLKNDRSVILYVNDRLHHKNKRLVDLSKTAAEKLGFVSSGITKVKVEVLGKLRGRKVE
ncbi:MAG: septal ring lytic transglycosylase RlpA family protein [Chitinophagaceae bacterium]|nr:septal ring lytic transglycosylase RlpA family protein [Chitinophagaceae bacterium]